MPSRPAARNSYISEHTVEFYLVPEFTRLLSREFDSTLAFFYWASREGRQQSPKTAPTQLRLVAVYPRRPKRSLNGREQFMKINHEILDHASALQRRGIPVFVGFPLVNSVFDLAAAPFVWFSLVGESAEDIEVLMPPKSNGAEDWDVAVRGPLKEHEVRQLVKDNANTMTWEEAIGAINHVRFERKGDVGFGLFGLRYKPVYFAVW